MVTSVKKYSALLLLVVFSLPRLITVQAFVVDSITKPSVPEFTLRIVSYPYDVPLKTTTTIDEYTGKETTTIQPGYHVENKSIEIVIKNQPFTPYNLTKYTYYHRDFEKNGSIDGPYTVDSYKTINFYFNVQVKGHYGENWKSVGERYAGFEGPKPNVETDSQYTIVSIGEDYPESTLLDFRVRARIGYYHAFGPGLAILGYDFYGQESDWSIIQTLDLSETSSSPSSTSDQTPDTSVPSASPSQNSTTTPSQQNPMQPDDQTLSFNWAEIATFTVGGIVVALLIIVIAVLRRRVQTLEREKSSGV